MTTRKLRRPRGAALATALLLTVLLLTLGIGFLTFCQRDLQFQRRQQEANRAQDLARAGIEHFLYLRNKVPPAAPVAGATLLVEVIPNEEYIFFKSMTSGTGFTSIGRVMKSNGVDIAAERVIVVPRAPTPTAAYSSAYDQRL